jgi:alpha-mannosidase
MIGNAHIDPVWLWRWQAGVDEALATFRSAVDRCDEYPEFVFTRGESWVYEQVERLDPDLFERVRAHVKSGQWHVTGGQYLQPDANLPTEAGWRRQILHGQWYFEDRFGVRPNIGYNVDTFGHPATVPDVLASLGHIAYLFHRPGATQMELPAQTFRWRGSGGGEVLGFRISPNYVTHADNLYGQIMISAEAADPDLGHTMCFYGVGNHGGGPTRETSSTLSRTGTPSTASSCVSAHRSNSSRRSPRTQGSCPWSRGSCSIVFQAATA